jgi:hypothetical protein
MIFRHLTAVCGMTNPMLLPTRACIVFVIGTTYYKYRATTDAYRHHSGNGKLEHPLFKKRSPHIWMAVLHGQLFI